MTGSETIKMMFKYFSNRYFKDFYIPGTKMSP